MVKADWQLTESVDAVVFDCDGTLSRLEGIDELARLNGVGKDVCEMTAKAMADTGVTTDLYTTRLSMVKPRKKQLNALGDQYFSERTPYSLEVIKILQRLGKAVYIMSAGVNPAVLRFGEKLEIPSKQIYAVDLIFDEDGNYSDFDRASLLTTPGGKCRLMDDLRKKHASIIHIGDGMNDIDVKDCVTRFIGYGGIFYREKVASHSDYYILSTSLTPILPLVLTEEEAESLTEEERQYYDSGISLMDRREVEVRGEKS